MVAEHQTIHSALSLVLNQMHFVNIEKAYTVSLGMPFERFELPTGVTPAPDGCLTNGGVNGDCTTDSVHNFYGHNL